MTPADDPMTSQHLLLGAEAFSGCRPPSGDRRAMRATQNPLLSLTLMFSGSAEAEIKPTDYSPRGTKFAIAMQHYESSHWWEAFDHFADLAEQGHGEAARMAWRMWRYGPELFGIEFPADTDRRLRWLAAWRGILATVNKTALDV
jgi:hypothetical protein